MRNFMICCIVVFTMTKFTFGQTKEPPKRTSVDLGGGVTMLLVLIPAGEFTMGDDTGYESEKPVHKVKITKPFYLGKYVVTVQQWQTVMENKPDPKASKLPAGVAWDDCQTFLVKLNAKIGMQEGKFVLPTEAQWEYACRAGSTTKYCFGDDEARLGDYAWYSANTVGTPHPVGEKKSNAWKLYDMHGNVWEWCADWYDPGYYAKSPVDDPRGPATGSDRVNRGGALDRAAWICRSAFRSYGPASPGNCVGFRVARIPVE